METTIFMVSITHRSNTYCTNTLHRRKGMWSHLQTYASFRGNSIKDFKNVAGELALVFYAVKHNISYRSMDCTNKLLKDIVHDSNLDKKMPRKLMNKGWGYCEKYSAPRSVQDLIDVLMDSAKWSNFFTIGTDASNQKSRKIFPLVVRCFGPLSGVKNILSFIEQADETDNAVRNLIRSPLDTHK